MIFLAFLTLVLSEESDDSYVASCVSKDTNQIEMTLHLEKKLYGKLPEGPGVWTEHDDKFYETIVPQADLDGPHIETIDGQDFLRFDGLVIVEARYHEVRGC